MGSAGSTLVDLIIKQNKNKIEAAKNEIKNLMSKSPTSVISIVFKLMNGKSIIVPCFKSTNLFDVFLLLIEKAKDTEYSNIDKLKLYYNSVDISRHFCENTKEDVSCLKFTNDTPIIYINV